MKNNKSIFARVINGIKLGWAMPILPKKILKIDQNKYIRLFKIGGTLNTFYIMSGIGSNYNSYIFYFAIIWSILYIIYRLVLAFFILKQWFMNIINGEHIIRNSPVDLIGTILRRTFNTLKATSGLAIGTGFTYALCHELDDILEKEGKNPYFIPTLKSELEKYGLNQKIVLLIEKLGIKNTFSSDHLKMEGRESNIFHNMSSEDQKAFEINTGVNVSEGKKVWEYVQSQKNTNNPVSSELQQVLDTKDKTQN